jgi:hypothetical protein
MRGVRQWNVGSERSADLLQRLGKVVERVHHTVPVDGGVCVHDVVAPARTEDAVDEVGERELGGGGERVAQVVDRALQCSGRVEECV